MKDKQERKDKETEKKKKWIRIANICRKEVKKINSKHTEKDIKTRNKNESIK